MTRLPQPGPDRLTWDSIVLEGFGRFGGVVRLSLSPGANVLVAPNESGKSTLAAAVPALLFGLGGGSDPAGFGEGRFRSWQRSREFRGALLFTHRGKQYLIERDFDRRSVRLLQWRGNGEGGPGGEGAGGSWLTLVDEQHHAGAQRRGHSYSTIVSALIGITDRAILERTFYLAQPLPAAHELDAAVQGLLSGGGGAFEAALIGLHDRLRAITRYTAAVGVTTRDALLDRELEKIRGELDRLAAKVAEQSSLVDSMEGLQRAVAEARAGDTAARADLVAARRLHEAWQRWTGHRTSYEAALAAQLAAGKALGEARAAAAALAQARDLAAEFPEVGDLPSDAAASLAKLASVEEEVSAIRGAGEAIRCVVGERRAELGRMAADAQDYPQVVRDQPELLSHYDRLVAAVERDRATQQLRSELELAQAQTAAALEAARSWSRVAAWPGAEVRRLRHAAVGLVKRWQRLTAAVAEAGGITVEWSKAFAGIEPNMAPSLLDGWGFAALRLEGLRERGRQLAALQEEYSDFAALTDPEAARVSLEQLVTAKAALAEASRHRLGVEPAAFVWGAWGGLAALAIWLALGGPLSAGVLAGITLGGAALALWLGGRLVVRRRLLQASSRVREITSLPAAWLERDAASLEAMAQQMNEFLARRRALDPAKLGAETAEAEEALVPDLLGSGDSRDRVAELRSLHWRRQGALERAAGEREELGLCNADADDAPGNLSSVELATLGADPWPSLAVLARLYGWEPGTEDAGRLVAWLAERGDAWWDTAEQQASEWERLRREAGDLKRRWQELDTVTQDGSPMDSLRATVAPFDQDTPRDELARTVGEWRRLQESLALARRDLSRDQADLDNNERRLAVLARDAQDLRQGRLAPLLEAVGGDLAAARERLASGFAAGSRVKLADERLAGALRSQGAKDLEQLELRKLDHDNRVATVSSAWDALIGEFAALPPREAADDPERLDRLGAMIAGRYESAQASADGASSSLADLTRQLARAEGLGPPINLVQAAHDIVQLRRREAELVAEASALALAHQELSAALGEYQGEYREQLAAAATRYYGSLTGDARRVLLDESFRVAVEVPIPRHEQGQDLMDSGGGLGGPVALRRTPPVSLSQGAQDQMLVALRLAVADLLAGRVSLPLVFDDPFLTFDGERMGAMQRTFQVLGDSGRQLLLLTHRPEFAAWGAKAIIEPLSQWPRWEA